MLCKRFVNYFTRVLQRKNGVELKKTGDYEIRNLYNMTEKQLRGFELLKQEVEATFRQQVISCQESIHEWKGKQIKLFQDTLSETVGGYVSEKWFYTHLKVKKNEKLPRIDMLNLLSRYVGVADWQAFLSNLELEPVVKEEWLDDTPRPSSKLTTILLPLLALVIGGVFLLGSFFYKETTYQFCIVDQDDGMPIAAKNIEAFLLKKGESPLALTVDSLSCLRVENVGGEVIKLKIEALYYQPLLIHRSISSAKKQERIALKKDDYALMIHYFSMNKMKDWKERRAQLDVMLSDEAQIIQIHSQTGGGMALYNKEEFINKMTMPIKSLQNINILETKYKGKKIIEIRFVQNEK
ncbi:hypothetical protein [Aureispira sp. CCB-QB1]|uniref:hypothetical protein n=1 Tax=Aureispira sp. CCB-QB1 TaxID=1313421 RepID=UPI000697E3F4|nr:hypothetical protein [Aureispira sp. CCB-QB1]